METSLDIQRVSAWKLTNMKEKKREREKGREVREENGRGGKRREGEGRRGNGNRGEERRGEEKGGKNPGGICL